MDQSVSKNPPTASTPKCTLCQGCHLQFSTPANWKNSDPHTLAESLKLSPTDLVCWRDITRVISDNNYSPR